MFCVMAKENFYDWCPVMTPGAFSLKKATRGHEKHFGGPKQEVASFSPSHFQEQLKTNLARHLDCSDFKSLFSQIHLKNSQI